MANLSKAHLPCPDCGSHDALSKYDDGSTYCFSCNTYHKGKVTEHIRLAEDAISTLRPDAGVYPVDGIPDRRLTADTCKKYGVKVVVQAGGIAQHIYPYYDKSGALSAQKIRTVSGKQFHTLGNMHKGTLFGQNLFPAKGKYITVCEGEVDCMSIYQMQGSKYPVVSIKNGSQDYRTVKDNYEYLDSFDNIIICFDGDEAGRKGAQKVAEILPPKKVKIVKMPDDMKDANEFLKAGKVEDFQNLWWKAEEYKPQDIVSMDEMWERLQEFSTSRSYIPTPWQGLNEMMYGVRPSQVVVFAAGSGQGKAIRMNEPVLTTTGWKLNKDLKIGDQLASVDGKPSEVIGIYPQGQRQMYKITFSDKRTAVVDGEHLWEIQKGSKGKCVVNTLEIKRLLTFPKYHRHLSIPLFTGEYGVPNTTGVDMYTLGFLLGDGSLGSTGIQFTTADEEVLQHIKGEVHKLSNKYAYSIVKESRLRQYLVNNGLNTTAVFKHIPEELFSLCREERLSLLQGLMDSDGSVDKFGFVEFSSISKKLAEDTARLAQSLGYITNVCEGDAKLNGKVTGKRYRFVIRGKYSKELFRLSRKRDRIDESKKAKPLTILSVEEAGVEEAQCIRVSHPSALFIMGQYIVTHNSLFLKTFIQHILKTTDIRVGAFFLEEVAEDTTISLMSLEAGINLRKPDIWQAQKTEDLKRWFDAACAGHRLDLFDGFDFDDIDLLIDKIRYLSRARDCKVIILDHITMVAEGSEENTVAKLNKLMAELKKVAVAESIVILAACHLRKSANANKTHEEGGHVSLDDLKSSSSIKQLSDVVIGLERNSQDEDKVKANTTVLRVLKNRDFGTKGPAAAVVYDTETTRLVETSLDEVMSDDI